MPQAPRGYDYYGHDNSASTQLNAGYTTATTGTAAGTVVNPGTADPTGTTNIVAPNAISDGYGQFTITTAGSQTTGALRTIYFTSPYPALRPVQATISTTGGTVAAGGSFTTTMSLTSLAFSMNSALTTSTTYNVTYQIL
jgi:hypothetical protein